MASTALKLVSEKPVTDEPLFFERRTDPRRRATGPVTAVIGAREDAGHATLRRICSLELLDMSSRGVGVWSDQPLQSGTSITLYVPAHGPDGGFDLIHGRIVSSDQADQGHRIGVRLYPTQTIAA
jgi:hypothetical protein